MADSKYMPQQKAWPGYKVGVSGILPYNGYEVNPNGKSEAGSMNRYQNHLSIPAITHTSETTDAGYIIKTETIVEYSRVPMANAPGNNPPSFAAPTGTNVNPLHYQPEATLPHKTGPVKNFRWWYKPKSNDTGEHDRKNDAGIDKSNKLGDTSIHQQYFDISREETYETGKPTMSITSGWGKPKILGKEAPLKRIPVTNKPTNTVQTATYNSKDETIIVAPTQNHVSPYVVSHGELLLPTIDNREAARRYGGVATSSVEAYAPAIDSNEAAWKYRGQII